MCKNLSVKHFAEDKGEGIFRFNDGSEICVDVLGVVVMYSACKSIPPIYLPSVIDKSLGLATKNVFAGNQQYQFLPYFDLSVLEAGEHKLALVKLITNVSGLPLKDVKSKMDNLPCLIPQISINKIKEVKKALQELQVKVELSSVRGKRQVVIENEEFFNINIKGFITNVDQYGT